MFEREGSPVSHCQDTPALKHTDKTTQKTIASVQSITHKDSSRILVISAEFEMLASNEKLLILASGRNADRKLFQTARE